MKFSAADGRLQLRSGTPFLRRNRPSAIPNHQPRRNATYHSREAVQTTEASSVGVAAKTPLQEGPRKYNFLEGLRLAEAPEDLLRRTEKTKATTDLAKAARPPVKLPRMPLWPSGMLIKH